MLAKSIGTSYSYTTALRCTASNVVKQLWSQNSFKFEIRFGLKTDARWIGSNESDAFTLQKLNRKLRSICWSWNQFRLQSIDHNLYRWMFAVQWMDPYPDWVWLKPYEITWLCWIENLIYDIDCHHQQTRNEEDNNWQIYHFQIPWHRLFMKWGSSISRCSCFSVTAEFWIFTPSSRTLRWNFPLNRLLILNWLQRILIHQQLRQWYPYPRWND